MRILFLSSLLLAVVLASKLATLDTLGRLRETGFGQPPPRHGLSLLKWYVRACLDNNMKALCDPVAGEYGFHRFHNNETLLPLVQNNESAYFTLGNLRSPGAKCLPDYVKMNYSQRDHLSNMDRVLVKYEQVTKLITGLYISKHYQRNETYVIGRRLLARLRQLTPRFNIKM